MALTTYSDLQASVASWLNRSDLAAQIPDFIALAESSIANDVRVRDMVKTATLSTIVAQNSVDLPADWLEFVDVRYGDNPLKLVSSNEITLRSSDTDTAMFYAIEGSRLLLAPVPNAVVQLNITYYGRLPALSSSLSNAVLRKYPQIYLCKALAWAAQFVMDTAKAEQWEAMYRNAIASAQGSEMAGSYSGAPLRVRTQ